MSSSNGEPKLRIAIIGGGMGGLVLGLCLKKYAADTVHFDIYESAAELTEVGAGVGMSSRIWSIMRELDLEEELLTITGTRDRNGFPDFWLRKGDEKQPVDLLHFAQVHTFQRSILQQLLAKQLDAGDSIHFSKRLISYSEVSPTDPITLNFKDGTTATCDLVIGSDGIRSAVRRTMFSGLADEAESRGQREEAEKLRNMIDPIWSGEVAYRGLAPANTLSEELSAYVLAALPQILCGKNGNMVIYPVSGGKLITVLATKYTPGAGMVYDGLWSEPTTGEAVVKEFEGWDPRALGLIKAVQEPFAWALHAVRELPTYVKGRAALVGDAAHAMLPHQGAGVGQAFEDGYILATVLAHPSVTLANLPAALAVYDDVRRPFSQGVRKGSQRNGMNYQLRRMGWENVSAEDSRVGRYPRELLRVLGEEVGKQIEWLRSTSILGEREGVVERLAALSA
ncbi:hypothetical protein GSI_03175 [Ganoderma sinense ZZ0214-1]|uniref:FAD-binding domain-containing protein n=1 Tax=Ganoderma sinense ZZ0214-1 TaxID=1077348 RepID=A0A2G8SKW8_9APHY|nr:hypothetical protein GSI_03175 [Ganoderma sinense ZZ0214-1]